MAQKLKFEVVNTVPGSPISGETIKVPTQINSKIVGQPDSWVLQGDTFIAEFPLSYTGTQQIEALAAQADAYIQNKYGK